MKRGRGRPRKANDTMGSWRLPGIAEAQSVYNESRKKGNKHRSAVTDAAKSSDHPMSESCVKRILAELQPKDAETGVLFERKQFDGQARRKLEWIREQVALLHGDTAYKPERVPSLGRRAPKVYSIRLAERPNYTRHNRRVDSE